MWARVVAVAAGLWLMAAPAVLGHVDRTAEVTDRIVGPIAAASAFIAIWGVCRPLRWVQLPLGAWLVAAPWILGHPLDAALSELAVGVVLMGTAFVRGTVATAYAGGWSSLAGEQPGVPEGSSEADPSVS